MRQELLAPVTALVGYGELLIEEGTSASSSIDLAPDLRTDSDLGAQDLLELVDRLLDEDGVRRLRPIVRRSRGELQVQDPARSA